MSVQPDQEYTVTPSCWCCGTKYPKLNSSAWASTPKLACVWGVRGGCNAARSSATTSTISPAALLRTGIQGIRATVIRRGWHERGILGNLLRWIDRHLP